MSKFKAAFGYLSGYRQTVNAGRELKNAATLPIYFIKNIYHWVSEIRIQAKAGRHLAELDDELLWDDICLKSQVTNESLRRAYKSLIFVNFVLVLSVAAVLAYFVASWGQGKMLLFANGVFLNMVLMLLFQNAYRIHMAYTQSAPHPLRFLREIFKRPSLLIGRVLPNDYCVRVRAIE
ncbi:hypothetical protein [Pseudomonas fontis]|uniref:Uncharacterized protein n=1 Tax=Pseudomonas fontis TaxID=2942633 RepID=A0ABT5NQX5_9PSED|nr:hypothetical protein [Pseudomonas fontis]MDD0972633.1 hypothetical protein [Pseudomonas fontis]MDD0990563.1 hypothetical protein [Pseudomonas fontis]